MGVHELGTLLSGLNTIELIVIIIGLGKYWKAHSEVVERLSRLEGQVDILVGERK